jgi:hypothetical protein
VNSLLAQDEQVIPTIVIALRQVVHPRFFANERGFQGQFQANLQAAGAIPPNAILEEEHQKTLARHGIRRRPDLTLHVPTPVGGNVRVGNFAVFELKRTASAAEAREDFNALDDVVGCLDYPLGVFINIDDHRTHADQYNGRFRDRLHFLSVRREGGQTLVLSAHYGANGLIEEEEV